MDFNEVKELIDLINSSELRVFEIEIDGTKIKMSKNLEENSRKNISEDAPTVNYGYVADTNMIDKRELPQETVKITQADKEITGNVIKAPIVGTIYTSSAPGKDDFVNIGDSVKKGDVVCIVEAMKVMNEVVSEFDGEVKVIHAVNDTLVQYGQPLFTIG